MSRAKTVFHCTECGAASAKWVGRCPLCDQWNTLVEEIATAGDHRPAGVRSAVLKPVPITEVSSGAAEPIGTGVGEFDRVLGGGLVAGSVTLLGGEPGIGKSTLLIDVASRWAAAGRTVLYISAEESIQQVQRRAERIGALQPTLFLSAETALGDIVAVIESLEPSLVIVDSVQTIYDPEMGSAPGSVGQVRECAYRLVRVAKQRALATILVGHVTKDGALAGPRVLEHVVDTVLAFDGDRHHNLRMLRASKHRFGSTNELGLFEMADRGLVGVPDAGGLFLTDRRADAPGSVIVPTLDGVRPLLVEVQALVAPTSMIPPRRSVQGVDAARVAMILAVLDKRVGISVSTCEVYASVAGGVRVVDPGADLALAVAVASSFFGVSVAPEVVVCAEIGLAGELRQVGGLERRLAEAAQLGFRHAVVPRSAPAAPDGMTLARVSTLVEAIDAVGLCPR
jgi:DNA repair protein RadA/Sms